MTRFRKLPAERERFRGSLITVATASFEDPAGEQFERDVVHHPGAVSVVPVVGDEVILVRQYRAAVDRELLEIPAGKRDVDGEPPEQTAARELAEEIGMQAGRLDLLAEFYNSPGFCDEHSYVFLGRDLTECATDFQGVEEQHMTIERLKLDDVPTLIATGDIVDAKTIIGVCLARERLAR